MYESSLDTSWASRHDWYLRKRGIGILCSFKYRHGPSQCWSEEVLRRPGEPARISCHSRGYQKGQVGTVEGQWYFSSLPQVRLAVCGGNTAHKRFPAYEPPVTIYMGRDKVESPYLFSTCVLIFRLLAYPR